MSMLSMIILPPEGSTSLKKTWIKVDFPLPVLPTTPIFSPPLMLNVMPFRTKGVLGRYLTCFPDKIVITNWYCSMQIPYSKRPRTCFISNIYLSSQLVTCNSLISTLPWSGQFRGGRRSLIRHAASDGIFVNCLILSTDTILFSMKQLMYMAQNNTAFRDKP